MFHFREGITFVAAAWKGEGAISVFIVLYSDDPSRKIWKLYQQTTRAPGKSTESTHAKEVETPDHALQGTLNMLAQLGPLRGLSRLIRADIQSDSYEIYSSKIEELEGVDFFPLTSLGIIN